MKKKTRRRKLWSGYIYVRADGLAQAPDTGDGSVFYAAKERPSPPLNDLWRIIRVREVGR
jgi:hypothetical protein